VAMNLRVPWNAGNFLTSCKPVSFSRRTLHHGVSKCLCVMLTCLFRLCIFLFLCMRGFSLVLFIFCIFFPFLRTFLLSVYAEFSLVLLIVFCTYVLSFYVCIVLDRVQNTNSQCLLYFIIKHSISNRRCRLYKFALFPCRSCDLRDA